MIEVSKRKPRQAKPPEDRTKAYSEAGSQNWRTQATKGTNEDESSSEEEELANPVTERRVKIAEVRNDGEKWSDGVAKLPYKAVPPLNQRIRETLVEEGSIEKNTQSNDEKSYIVRAPVQKDGLGKKLARQAGETMISVSLRELWGVSPDVRDQTKAMLTKTRRSVLSKPDNKEFVVAEQALPFYDDDDLRLEYDALSMGQLPPISSVFVTTVAEGHVPAGSVVVQDPYVQYLASLGEDETPRQVWVARDSDSLRVVFPIVNSKAEVESVTDSGSQIVSTSYEQAVESGLSWDPDIQIYMQSANGTLEKSVGLAKNVPFKFGDITVFLQVHIIRGPAYKILLGRPFEVLTESMVQNRRDGSQTITMKCPNTGRRCTMPTHARSKNLASAKPKRATVESVLDEGDKPNQTADPEPSKNEAGFHQSSRN